MIKYSLPLGIKYFSTYFEVRPIILGDVWAVALRQYHNLLLYVLDLIFRFFEIDDLDGHDLLGPIVDALKDLAEATLSDSLLFRKYQLRIHLLQQKFNDRLLLLLVRRLLLLKSFDFVSLRSFAISRVISVKSNTDLFMTQQYNKVLRNFEIRIDFLRYNAAFGD